MGTGHPERQDVPAISVRVAWSIGSMVPWNLGGPVGEGLGAGGG